MKKKEVCWRSRGSCIIGKRSNTCSPSVLAAGVHVAALIPDTRYGRQTSKGWKKLLVLLACSSPEQTYNVCRWCTRSASLGDEDDARRFADGPELAGPPLTNSLCLTLALRVFAPLTLSDAPSSSSSSVAPPRILFGGFKDYFYIGAKNDLSGDRDGKDAGAHMCARRIGPVSFFLSFFLSIYFIFFSSFSLRYCYIHDRGPATTFRSSWLSTSLAVVLDGVVGVLRQEREREREREMRHIVARGPNARV